MAAEEEKEIIQWKYSDTCAVVGGGPKSPDQTRPLPLPLAPPKAHSASSSSISTSSFSVYSSSQVSSLVNQGHKNQFLFDRANFCLWANRGEERVLFEYIAAEKGKYRNGCGGTHSLVEQ
ncbi:hypothetical protein TYRP_007726 [Tyrophagus putrescentiae]|nr:hypothetical protein TYRP_007726 [Tyrophagus putrescentiae]